MIRRVLEAIGAALGIVAVISIFLIGVLSLPLAVISWIRWFEWDWYWALVGIFIMQVIPGLGQLGFVVFAGFGAYYMIDADFDWRLATNPYEFRSDETVLIATTIEDTCKNDSQQFFLSGMTRDEFDKFCECFGVGMVSYFDVDEMRYQQEHNEPSQKLQNATEKTAENCQNNQ
ncbi:MAG: hypothetical protein WD673_01000 [Alphaproteobacteria bacterium]